MKLTRAQREAIKRIYLRNTNAPTLAGYVALRRKVEGTFFMGNCVMVPVAGMWLGVEIDGYTHS